MSSSLVEEIQEVTEHILREIRDHAEVREREGRVVADNILIERDPYTDEPVYDESMREWFKQWGVDPDVGIMVLRSMIKDGCVTITSSTHRTLAAYASHSVHWKEIPVYELS